MKKNYTIANFEGDDPKVYIGKRVIEIDLDDKGHKDLATHLAKRGAYEGNHKTEGTIVIIPDDCDLPEDKYKWTGNEFIPLGFGFKRPVVSKGTITRDHAIYLALKALVDGNPIPHECKKWVLWYEQNLKKRNEEHIRRIKGKGGGN